MCKSIYQFANSADGPCCGILDSYTIIFHELDKHRHSLLNQWLQICRIGSFQDGSKSHQRGFAIAPVWILDVILLKKYIKIFSFSWNLNCNFTKSHFNQLIINKIAKFFSSHAAGVCLIVLSIYNHFMNLKLQQNSLFKTCKWRTQSMKFFGWDEIKLSSYLWWVQTNILLTGNIYRTLRIKLTP